MNSTIVELFYGSGQVNGRSHALLKGALHALGLLPNSVVRPPIVPLTAGELSVIARVLAGCGIERGAGTPAPAPAGAGRSDA